ncbi:MAG: hypothetical protein J2P36_00440 [Ktedonobacteraceae bacterium]|nr:hypothetical protein [Ktedonobacteraceae bacterium]
MSKKVIGALYTLGLILQVGAVILFLLMHHPFPYFETTPQRTEIDIIIGLGSALIPSLAGNILVFIAWIGALVNLSKARAWPWFWMMFLFGGITQFLYLIGDSPAEEKQPSPTVRTTIFRCGLMGGGILTGIELVGFIFTLVLPSTLYWNILPSIFTRSNGYVFVEDLTLLVFSMVTWVLPAIAALPVLFWVSKRAVERTNLEQAGRRAMRQVFGWWTLGKIVLFGVDLLLLFLLPPPPASDFGIAPLLARFVSALTPLDRIAVYLLWDLSSYLLAFLLLLGLSAWVGSMRERSSALLVNRL